MLLISWFLLLLPLTRAHRQGSQIILEPSNFSFPELPAESSLNGELCAKETTVHIRDTELTFRELWLLDVNRKLEILEENGIWIYCLDKENEERFSSGFNFSKCQQFVFSTYNSSTEILLKRCKLIVNNLSIKRDSHRNLRTKRELFLIPGTQWCGRGHRASKYTDLGIFSAVDSCCRQHDTSCRYYIPRSETRYGLTNWGLSSMMHCKCDERFRTCLKMADDRVADITGKIFFNVFRSECFVLKAKKVCTKRVKWGRCQKYEFRKQAFIRNNAPY